MKWNNAREQRRRDVNELLAHIAKLDDTNPHRKPFFGYRKPDTRTLRTGQFIYTESGQLRYQDARTKELMSASGNSTRLYDACSEGGTGQRLIKDLYPFIVHGTTGHLYDYKETWGFINDAAQSIRQKAHAIGFIQNPHYPHSRDGQ